MKRQHPLNLSKTSERLRHLSYSIHTVNLFHLFRSWHVEPRRMWDTFSFCLCLSLVKKKKKLQRNILYENILKKYEDSRNIVKGLYTMIK